MNVVAACQSYVAKLVSGSGIKVLLLDPDTTSAISVVGTQSYLLEHEVYLVDRLANQGREKMRHLKALIFVRPTSVNVEHLVQELREPKYGDYTLVFSNMLSRIHLERLAEADEHECVKGVHEYYADYLAINTDFFSLKTHATGGGGGGGGAPSTIYGATMDEWHSESMARCSQGLAAVLLSLKRRPIIRYERNSALCLTLAKEMARIMDVEGKSLFEDATTRTDTPAILLLLDRRNDPITPLLTQWTYQAMVHDLLTITNGRVSLPHERAELREVIVSADSDAFFAQHMFLDFGDLGSVVKAYVGTYQARTTSSKNLDTIADMKTFIESYPEFRKLSGNVSKHVALMSELSRIVKEQHLLQVSELEQSIACNDTHTNDLRTCQQLLGAAAIDGQSKVRLVLLYAIRYERHPQNATQVLLDLLHTVAPDNNNNDITALVQAMLQFAGSQRRQEEIFDEGGGGILGIAKSGIKGLKGVENVYTQHRPHLERTLLSLSKARLSPSLFPTFSHGGSGSTAAAAAAAGDGRDRPEEIIVCVVGGVTYEEAKIVREINQTVQGLRVVLGGTSIVNSKQFIGDIQEASSRWPNAQQQATAKGRLAARIDR